MKRIAISGCGAVSHLYYAPAIKDAEARGRLKLAGAFDPDRNASKSFLDHFPGAADEPSFEGLLALGLDCLIIASPPAFHRPQAIVALRQGIPVHCEKPLAASLDDGAAMVAEAARAGARLSVNMVRRNMSAARSVGAMLTTGAIGQLRSIEIFEGGPFLWPVRSPAYFDKRSGALGVLDDIGTHVIDLLCWWLGNPSDIAYRDDAMGGIAANCEIEAMFGEARVHVRLSRDWHRPNCWTFTGSGGSIVWNRKDESVAVNAGSPNWRRGDSFKQGGCDTFEQAFAAPVSAMATDASTDVFVAGADVLSTLAAIETCRRVRTAMAMAWLE